LPLRRRHSDPTHAAQKLRISQVPAGLRSPGDPVVIVVLAALFALGVALAYDGVTRPMAPTRGRTGLGAMLGRRVGASITPEALVGQCVVGSLGAAVVAQLVLGWPAVTATMGALALVTPLVYWTEREEHRRVVSQAALVDAIGQLRAGLGSRRTLGEALAGLAVDGPPPLRDGFVEYARDASLTTVDRALMLLRERLADPIGDTLVATLLLAERLGGGAALARVLEQLAATSRRKLRARQEAAAAQTRLVWSARVVALIPLIVLVLIRTTSPGYLAVFDEPTGQVLLAGCALVVVAGYRWMLWLGRLPAEPRVLVAEAVVDR